MISEHLLTPGHEGSGAALQILHLLRSTNGCTVGDVCRLLGMSKATAQSALKGLQYRGRIRADGHGMAAMWKLALKKTPGGGV